ncbi:hypothetical protein ELI24_08605 [Rhizobium ruizarguesonis]|uniref:matrixin family metalloprotease n=1 Tax=Rhizobium ruizarguesonis TaxID=2081791 RepID=UPI00103150CC|nr:matrixin family metalloprotease [Rhizobium ruizarguesonis]TAV98441.1 hypothetical protein ELI24_08605 [Rhizobium ruizarguesonis]
MTLASTANADGVLIRDQMVAGRVVEINRQSLTIDLCDGKMVEFKWEVGLTLLVNSSCVSPSRAGLAVPESCDRNAGIGFDVGFRGRADPVHSEDVAFSQKTGFHISGATEVAHGPLSQVNYVRANSGCLDNAKFVVPSDFCVEPKQFAVNFSYDAPLPNRILTRGFSFYLETSQPFREPALAELREAIRGSFGTAINIWASDLWQRRDRYDKKLSSLLDGMASHSKDGFTMFIPPQVIALACPQTATFVIRVFSDPGPFARPPQKEILAAVAATPGRTILLNFNDYPCWKNALFKYVVDDATSCVNLVPILMHELGHAFGLLHEKEEIKSIMNPVILATTPSDTDLDRLAARLMEFTTGQPPGEIPFVDEGVAVRLK